MAAFNWTTVPHDDIESTHSEKPSARKTARKARSSPAEGEGELKE